MHINYKTGSIDKTSKKKIENKRKAKGKEKKKVKAARSARETEIERVRIF